MLVFLMAVENEETRDKLERLYKMYCKDMYNLAYSILKDSFEAEDVVQEAIIIISKHMDKVEEVKSYKTRGYLLVIVRNMSYEKYNKRKKIVLQEEVIEIDDIRDQSSYLEEELLKAEKAEKIASMLGEVNKSYADILMLRFYLEMEIGEIAEVLNITENNASVRIHRAMISLKKCIEKEGIR